MLNKVNAEIVGIINRHFNNIQQFATFTPPSECEISAQQVTETCKRLSALTIYKPELATEYLYRDVRHYLAELEQFLQEMGQPFDQEFASTHVGKLWCYATEWCAAVEEQNLPPEQVIWSLISPAAPDCLEDLGEGVYEARWWHPVPMMDIEILARTEYVTTFGQPYEPQGMPNGLALRFRIQPFLDAAL
jgi:hypothetical protein